MSYRSKHVKPKLRKLKPKKAFYKKPLFWVFPSVGLALLFTALFFFMPYIQVDAVEVSGNEKIEKLALENITFNSSENKIAWLLTSKSIFMVNKNKISEAISNEFPIIETVAVKKKFPDKIEVAIQERKPDFIFCANKCYFLDHNGVIFEEVSQIPDTMTILEKDSGVIDILHDHNVCRLNDLQNFFFSNNLFFHISNRPLD